MAVLEKLETDSTPLEKEIERRLDMGAGMPFDFAVSLALRDMVGNTREIEDLLEADLCKGQDPVCVVVNKSMFIRLSLKGAIHSGIWCGDGCVAFYNIRFHLSGGRVRTVAIRFDPKLQVAAETRGWGDEPIK